MDVATTMLPEVAVGRLIRVFWPDEDAWFLGTVAAYDSTTGKHEVHTARSPTFLPCLGDGEDMSVDIMLLSARRLRGSVCGCMCRSGMRMVMSRICF